VAPTFVPLLLGLHYGTVPVKVLDALVRRLPRTGFGPLDSFLDAASGDPE
jgi:hypothetical protein